MQEGIDLLDAHVLAGLTLEQTKHIFRSATPVEIPLLETRHKIMLSHAETLLKKYNGCFSNCLTSCNGSAADLLEVVTRDFPSFDDRAVFKGQPGRFDKSSSLYSRAFFDLDELLESGSALEVEIRGTCLHAVEVSPVSFPLTHISPQLRGIQALFWST
ncbi:unnamed protein product [Dibothriocephalus latus]|uniref:Queuosine 5'-phosphate N-glycosylase/hydrolase n=1 Tax=Dibothriocephalus latus TaxID=60516 RepID=A0A3P6TFR2_DIBLA|nr:unnamed protein product [Dibothriocephalus latus]